MRDTFLLHLADRMRPLTDADAIVNTAARMLCEYLGVERCLYGNVAPDQETIQISGGYTTDSPNLVGQFPLSQFGLEVLHALRANRPLPVSDVEADPRFREVRHKYQQAQIRSFCLTPLHKDGQLVAAMGLNQKEPRIWKPDEVELVHLAANRCWESIERARVTRELRQQRHYFDAVLSNTPDLTYSFDLQGRFTYANRALTSLLQLPLDHIVGKTFHELPYPPELARQLMREIQQVIDTKEALRNQSPFSGATGETRIYEYIFSPVFSADGSVEAVAGSTRDVTEREQAEEQEKEREEQIRESARLESLGVMAGGIAHDFNNLLTGILGNAWLLAEGLQGPDGAIARQIVTAAERAADLTRQMLAFSGKGRFVVERVDLNALVRENLTLLHASLSKTITVELDLSSEPYFVEADPSQIQQIVMNLLINASEAVGEVPGTVKVRTAATNRVVKLFSPFLQTAVQPGPYVQLEVSDSGCGMSPETLKSIFDPFFTTKFTGRGLGLAAVLGIVKGHQGDLEVITELGRGTTFRVLLPLAERGEEPPPVLEAKSPSPTTQKTILVVDDEEIVRKIASVALSRRGYRVLLAENGEEALAVLRDHANVALVILDLTMPVMTGEQAIPLIKALRPELPIVLSSGFNEAEVSHRFASAGISGFLQKPYAVSAIFRLVGGLLNTADNGTARAE